MTNTHYCIRGGGRWREIDLDNGRVNGWGFTSFVYVSRGKLVVANKTRVLRALRNHAKGDTRGCIRDGPRLSLKRPPIEKVLKRKSLSCRHRHCCQAAHICHNQQSPVVQDVRSEAFKSTKVATANACAQTETNHSQPITGTKPQVQPSKRQRIENHTDTANSKHEKHEWFDDKQIARNHSGTSSEVDSIPSKELLIDENEIEMIRSCIERNVLFSDADLELFDTMDDYKKRIFYRLNPLVHVERCPKIQELIETNIVSYTARNDISIEKFLSKLGLRHIRDVKERKRYRTRNTIPKCATTLDDDTLKCHDDKENRVTKLTKNANKKLSLKDDSKKLTVKNGRYPMVRLERKELSSILNKTNVSRPNEIIGISSSDEFEKSDSLMERLEPKVVEKKVILRPMVRVAKPKPIIRGTFREYSPSEDRAIINWVKDGSRANKVNGNAIWKQLETEFKTITGQARSWHSLRNRYLRNILPQLGSLAAPHAAALRAAAAAGEIKLKRRRHSMFSPPKIGAASRKLALSAEPPRVLRSSLRDETTSTLPKSYTTDWETEQTSDSSKKMPSQSVKSTTQLINKILQSSKEKDNKPLNKSPQVSPNKPLIDSLRRSNRSIPLSPEKKSASSRTGTVDVNKPKRRKLFNP